MSITRVRHRWWRPWIPPLIGVIGIVALAVGPPSVRPAAAAYQATADSNETAFEPPCLNWDDPHPERMLSLATSGLAALGYDVKGYKGAPFTRSHVLVRTQSDWSCFVHSRETAQSPVHLGTSAWSYSFQRRPSWRSNGDWK